MANMDYSGMIPAQFSVIVVYSVVVDLCLRAWYLFVFLPLLFFLC